RKPGTDGPERRAPDQNVRSWGDLLPTAQQPCQRGSLDRLDGAVRDQRTQQPLHAVQASDSEAPSVDRVDEAKPLSRSTTPGWRIIGQEQTDEYRRHAAADARRRSASDEVR